jgi:hypothetical protein
MSNDEQHGAPDTFQVCPQCKMNDLLFSAETATVMYSISVVNGEHDYTGMESVTLDDGTEFEDDIWCRGCGWNGQLADLVTLDLGEADES